MNQLFYGDNLGVLRESIGDESVDLIYLDPPFNSKRDYNLLFKSPKGQKSEAQITAFEDSWHWGEQAEREFDEVLHQPNTDVAEMMRALRSFLGENDMMAYLTMMANRLLELHRVLKSTGSLYLHCDPTASHYLKIVLDGVFGKENYRNEIIWKRTTAHGDSRTRFSHVTDTIFFYAKSDNVLWNPLFQEHKESYLKSHYRHKDENGRVYRLDNIIRSQSMGPRPNLTYEYKGFTPPSGWRTVREKLEAIDADGRLYWSKTGTPYLVRYLDEQDGEILDNLWDDIPPVNSMAQERLGYPTQKPLALLERIVNASSNDGDVVLDPFCGCGTAVHAAQKLGRQWIGIDVTHLAISLIEKRLKDAFKTDCKFEVHGTPTDLDSARDLAARDKYQFQWWAVSLVDAQPFQGKKKGADSGIDGLKFFHDLIGDAKKIVVSVKGGGLKADDVRALEHVRTREKAEIALFISLAEPTRGMVSDAASVGFYT
ncbi:MAG: site-specific DNA-methyltransferase, partial [Planctomycetota bacterium]|nr:site-specific DNA-methyltransferase [Planctomycetota bacterium]